MLTPRDLGEKWKNKQYYCKQRKLAKQWEEEREELEQRIFNYGYDAGENRTWDYLHSIEDNEELDNELYHLGY